MIPIERLHYKLDMKLNRLASNEHQQISKEDKDFAINESMIRLIKRKIGDKNIYGIGFDGFRKRYQDLEFLVVEHEKKVPTKTNGPISIYSFNKTTLLQKFFLPVDIYTECSFEGCTDRIVVVENIVKHSNVPLYLSSTHLQPSFRYQATFAVFSSGNINIYSEDPQGIFKIDKIYISYIRYPDKVCFGDYEDFDGTPLLKRDCEFPEHLEDELLEITVQELALNTENQFAAQAAQLRIKESDN